MGTRIPLPIQYKILKISLLRSSFKLRTDRFQVLPWSPNCKIPRPYKVMVHPCIRIYIKTFQLHVGLRIIDYSSNLPAINPFYFKGAGTKPSRTTALLAKKSYWSEYYV